MRKRFLVTGGAGFMGSAFIRCILQKYRPLEKVVNLDVLTYAGNLKNLQSIEQDPRYLFVRGNILNGPLVEEICRTHAIDTIVHFAAESHVDRSIHDPRIFYETNVGGTLTLLEVARRFPHLHFHHISTDEVYGSIVSGHFSEEAPYSPNSPYSASKAASDHFVRAYGKTYGISFTISHSSNNYGPHQYAEKFIPHMIQQCIKKKPLPVYGQGLNVRDWLYVDDHAQAVLKILESGKSGETYNIGAGAERKNIDLLHLLIKKFARLKGEEFKIYESLITFVTDRPGHDLRYGIDCSKIQRELGWKPQVELEEGLANTIKWYLGTVKE